MNRIENNAIKYHEHRKNMNNYDANGHLTNNWDPDADYGDEYVALHINIHTPTYQYDNGFDSPESREQWGREASTLIRSFNIMEGTGYDCERKKRAYLHAHPQQISGVVLKNNVKQIVEAVNNMKYSCVRFVELRETIYDISDEVYEKYLDRRKKEIRKLLFENAATTRRIYFCNGFDLARAIANKVRLPRLGLNDGKNYGSGQTIEYILKIANEMAAEGYLKRAERSGNVCFRSLNKTEQEKSKLTFSFT